MQTSRERPASSAERRPKLSFKACKRSCKLDARRVPVCAHFAKESCSGTLGAGATVRRPALLAERSARQLPRPLLADRGGKGTFPSEAVRLSSDRKLTAAPLLIHFVRFGLAHLVSAWRRVRVRSWRYVLCAQLRSVVANLGCLSGLVSRDWGGAKGLACGGSSLGGQWRAVLAHDRRAEGSLVQ